MTGFIEKTLKCLDYLRLVFPMTGEHPGDGKDDRYREWLKAAYDEPGFLDEGDYFSVYESCREKAPGTLSKDEVRACVTFLIRQMRNQYAPYPCLAGGELLALLDRWIELNEEED